MKYLKPFNESNFTLQQRLEHNYGKNLIEEYTQLMDDIKDRCYDLIDLGFDVKVDWAYSTKERLTDKTPKVEILITGDSSNYDQSWNEEALPTIEIIRGLIRSGGFSSGSGFVPNQSGSIRNTYKIIFQY